MVALRPSPRGLDRELRVGCMRKALNDAFVPLSDDASCFAAYRRAGIAEYDDADHAQAVEYARLWRAQLQNVVRQLEPAA